MLNNYEHNHLKQILDNSPDGIFTINNELEILYANPAFCNILGFSSDELVGSPITDFLADLNILNVCMLEVSTKGKCNDQETIFKRKDGSEVHISKNVQAIYDEKGKFQEILVSIRELTEIHKLYRELEESKAQLESYTEDLEQTLTELGETQAQLVESERMASLGSLVAGIAHEINTPLGISVTSASTMHEKLDELNKNFKNGILKRSELEDFLSQANQACKILNTNLYRAADLVKSFKQVAVDQTADNLRDINLNEYLNEILTSVGPKYKHRPINVVCNCDDNINICTHPGAISQIISNLIINSLLHAFGKNEAGNITINASKKNTSVSINYKDDGRGMTPECLKKIYEPFFTTRRGQGGSGLGMSILYNLVTGTLKGNISVTSEEGKGMEVKIEFPIPD